MTADGGQDDLGRVDSGRAAAPARVMSVRGTLGLPERSAGSAISGGWRWVGAAAMASGVLLGSWFLLDHTVFALGGDADPPTAPFTVLDQTGAVAVSPSAPVTAPATGTPTPTPTAPPTSTPSAAPVDSAASDPGTSGDPAPAPAPEPAPTTSASDDESSGHGSGGDDDSSRHGSGGDDDGDSSGHGSGGDDDSDSSGHGSDHD